MVVKHGSCIRIAMVWKHGACIRIAMVWKHGACIRIAMVWKHGACIRIAMVGKHGACIRIAMVGKQRHYTEHYIMSFMWTWCENYSFMKHIQLGIIRKYRWPKGQRSHLNSKKRCSKISFGQMSLLFSLLHSLTCSPPFFTNACTSTISDSIHVAFSYPLNLG